MLLNVVRLVAVSAGSVCMSIYRDVLFAAHLQIRFRNLPKNVFAIKHNWLGRYNPTEKVYSNLISFEDLTGDVQ
jgi:hypothetical protein